MSNSTDSSSSLTAQQTIIVATSVVGGLVAIMLGFTLVSWYRKKHPSAASIARREARAAAAAAAAPTTRRSRPRRNASVRTVPEYTEEAKDEEMVLEKAEMSTRERSGSDSSSHQDGHVSIHITDFSDDATIIVPGRSRAGTGLSRMTLRDIDPAPELRVSKYDNHTSDYASSNMSPGHTRSSFEGVDTSRTATDLGPYAYGQLPAASMSNVSVGSTLDDSRAGSRNSASWNRSTTSLFEAPSYANRNRSHSIDIDRSSDLGHQSTDALTQSSGSFRPSIDNAASRRESGISLHSLIVPNLSKNSKSVDPMLAARRAALHRREISAPLSDTLVHNSYDMPKAGLSTLQATWLGSRDAITRMTAYLRPTPPTFDEIDEEAGPSDQEVAGASSSAVELPSRSPGDLPMPSTSAEPAAAPAASHVLNELQEESRRLSSLVHRASIRRSASSGLPAHLIALPQSGPNTPVSPTTPIDWPTGLSRGPSINGSLAASIVRLRKDSSRSQTMQSLAEIALPSSASADVSLVIDTGVENEDGAERTAAVAISPTDMTSPDANSAFPPAVVLRSESK